MSSTEDPKLMRLETKLTTEEKVYEAQLTNLAAGSLLSEGRNRWPEDQSDYVSDRRAQRTSSPTC